MRGLALCMGVLTVAAGQAAAADRTASVRTFEFRPGTITVNRGDTVTWRWRGPDTNHSVTADPRQSERFDSDPSRRLDEINHPVGFTFAHRFTRAGSFTYRCAIHPDFMRGTVVVRQRADHEPPRMSALEVEPTRFCTRRTRRCRRPGTQLRIRLSEPAILRGRIERVRSDGGRRLARSLRRAAGKGSNELRLHGRGLRPGGYRLTLQAVDAVGNVSRPVATRFVVTLGLDGP